VHVLKEHGQTRLAATRVTFNRVEINNGDLECLQNLASGLGQAGNTNEKYEKIKQSLAKWLKDEIDDDFHPNYVVALPSRRSISKELAKSLAGAYGDCTDLSEWFRKEDPELRSGLGSAKQDSLRNNLICTGDMKWIKSGDSILIVDDIFSTGASMDIIKERIISISGVEELRFLGAAILKV